MLDLMRYEPFEGRLPRLFNGFFSGPSLFRRLEESEDYLTPKVDVSENENEYLVKAEVPGLSGQDIKVEIERGLLKLSGERREEKEEKDETYHVRERRYGSFVRTFILPENVDEEKISAVTRDGILTVTIPKAEKDKPRHIEVKVN